MAEEQSISERSLIRQNKRLRDQLALHATLRQRRNLAGALGKQFGGDRDIYDALGYDRTLEFDDYEAKYTRQDISGRVVDLPANDTWRKPPTIKDGDDEDTKFLQDFKKITKDVRLWHYCERVDRLAGIGRFGILLMGFKDGKDLDKPVEGQMIEGGLLYLSAYSEGSVAVKTIETDVTSARFGLPVEYEVDIGANVEGAGVSTQKKKVHHSRVIHVAEDLLEDEIYGRPRLERIYNRLMDLEKVVGASAEATWKLVWKGMIITAKEGYGLEDGDIDEDELDEFVHEMRRVLELEGVDVQMLGGQVVDPSGLFEILIGLVAGETSIPQRLLLGSERGELASTQDEAKWAGVIESRRINYAEPTILRPFIDRCIEYGLITDPTDKDGYTVEWEPLFALTDIEWSEVGKNIAEAIERVSPPGSPDYWIDGDKFLAEYFPRLSGLVHEPEELLDEEDDDFEEDEAVEFPFVEPEEESVDEPVEEPVGIAGD